MILVLWGANNCSCPKITTFESQITYPIMDAIRHWTSYELRINLEAPDILEFDFSFYSQWQNIKASNFA